MTSASTRAPRLLALAALACLAGGALEQQPGGYPAKPIQLIAQQPPGCCARAPPARLANPASTLSARVRGARKEAEVMVCLLVVLGVGRAPGVQPDAPRAQRGI